MGIGTLLIRADASPEIGTGHVMRCVALAQEWQERGGNPVFVMAQCTPAVHARLVQETFEVVPCAAAPGGADDALITTGIARRYGSEWLVLDGYAFSSDYQTRIQQDGKKVLFVDDLAGCDRYAADIVLNQNLSASEGKYWGLTGAQMLVGTRYCLLRREFRAWTGWSRNIPERAEKILITLGGSTPENLALRIFEALERVRSKITSAILVLGGSSAESALLNRAAANLAGTLTIERAPMDMATLMAQADIAISAAGGTCWELCFLGLPSLLVDIAENQTPEAVELHRYQAAKYIGNATAVSADSIVISLLELLGSEETRRTMSTRSRKLVDGHGPERVVSAMLERKTQLDPVIHQESSV